MSIDLFSGTPGTGKSLDAAGEVRFQLSRPHPRPVLGNFELAADAPVKAPELYTYAPNAEFTPEFLTDYATKFWESQDFFREEYLTLVLDECQLIFNSRNWANRDRLAWVEFFSQHRKYGYHVILIAQSIKMIDNQMRFLVEYEVAHRKLSSMGVMGDLLSLPFGGKLFWRSKYLLQNGDRAERIGGSWYVAKRRDMRMYDTHKTFNKVMTS